MFYYKNINIGFQLPPWDQDNYPNDATKLWGYIDANQTSETFSSSNFGIFAATTNKYLSGVMGANGFIYGIPYSATAVLKINPATDSYATFGSLSGTTKWLGAVAVGDYIYASPGSSTSVLKIDTTDDSITTFGSLGTTANKHFGMIRAQNGMLYCAPTNQSYVLKIDPSTDTTSTITDAGIDGTTAKWIGGFLTSDGKVGFVPFANNDIMFVDTADDSVSYAGLDLSSYGAQKWGGCIPVSKDKWLFVSYNSNDFVLYDYQANTATGGYFGSLPSAALYAGGARAMNGNAYPSPHSGTTIQEYNIATDQFFNKGSIAGAAKWYGGVLAQNGAIYYMPRNTTTILKILSGVDNFPMDLVLSRYLNKF